MRWLDGIAEAKDTDLGKLWELVRDRLSLACCSPWGREELDTIWQLNNNKLSHNKVLSLCSRSAKAYRQQKWVITNMSEIFHKPLVLLHQRADRLKTTITEN